MTGSLLVTRRDAVATIVLNRPEVLNALDAEMGRSLAQATAELARDRSVRCVVVTGAGAHFMAGGDLVDFRRLLALDPDQRRERVRAVIADVHRAIRSLRRAPQPVVASVRGACAGFGLSLMMACDLALASDDAAMSLAYCNIGATPDGGATHALPRLVGARRATAIALLGERFGAGEALAMGLVNRVVAGADLAAETAALAARLARGPAGALARTKRLLADAAGNDLDAQLRAEEESFVAAVAGDEFAEGVNAFLDKRPPRF